MGNFNVVDYILKKGEEIQTLEELDRLIEEAMRKFNFDVTAATESAGAVCTVVANFLSKKMGIPRVSRDLIMWSFITNFKFPSATCGLRLINFDHMLYPQYKSNFKKTIGAETWKRLQEEAKRNLEGRIPGKAKTIAHWQSIVNGVVPFGYKVRGEGEGKR